MAFAGTLPCGSAAVVSALPAGALSSCGGSLSVAAGGASACATGFPSDVGSGCGASLLPLACAAAWALADATENLRKTSKIHAWSI
eukprot:12382802-Heterocapsa_arctica.AAC.1